jgi:hypothetical protein
MPEKSNRYAVAGSVTSGFLLVLLLFGTGVFQGQSGYASEHTSAAVSPWFTLPGRSVLVTAEGLSPNSNATVYVKNVVAKVEMEKAGEATKTVTFPDRVVVGKTETMPDGTLEWALGIPRDEVKVIERWISNSTGQEEVLKTVTTTYTFQGTVEIVVVDEVGHSADAELTIIKWITASPFG